MLMRMKKRRRRRKGKWEKKNEESENDPIDATTLRTRQRLSRNILHGFSHRKLD